MTPLSAASETATSVPHDPGRSRRPILVPNKPESTESVDATHPSLDENAWQTGDGPLDGRLCTRLLHPRFWVRVPGTRIGTQCTGTTWPGPGTARGRRSWTGSAPWCASARAATRKRSAGIIDAPQRPGRVHGHVADQGVRCRQEGLGLHRRSERSTRSGCSPQSWPWRPTCRTTRAAAPAWSGPAPSRGGSPRCGATPVQARSPSTVAATVVKAEVVSRTTAHRFEVLPRRWVAERTWA